MAAKPVADHGPPWKRRSHWFKSILTIVIEVVYYNHIRTQLDIYIYIFYIYILYIFYIYIFYIYRILEPIL